MYFQIENTPENKIKKKNVAKTTDSEEENPCLVLAPFTAAPKVIFDNIPVGTVAERCLDIVNPTTKTLQILLGKAPPPGLTLMLPADHISLAPQEAYCVTLRWVPAKPVAQRETIHFTDEQRGRYDVVVILKAVIIAKKTVKTKVIRKSPTKLVKKIGVRTSPKRLKEMSPKIKLSTPRSVKTTEKRSIRASIASFRKQELHNYVDIRVPKNKPMCPASAAQIYHESNSEHADIRLHQNKFHDNSYSIQDKTSTYSLNLDKTVDIKPDYKQKEYYKDKAVLGIRNMLSPSNVLSAIDNCNFTPLKSLKTTPCKSNRSEKENIYHGHQNVNSQPAYNNDQPYSFLTHYHQNDVRKQLSVSPNVDEIFENVNFTPLRGEKLTERFAMAQETEDIRRDTYAIKRPSKPIPLSYENSPDSLEEAKPSEAMYDTHPIINISDYKDDDSVQLVASNMHKDIVSDKSIIAIDVTVDKGKAAIEVKSPNVTLDKTPPRGYHVPCIGVTVNNVSCPHLNDADITFNPHSCSTEMKNSSKENCTSIPKNILCKGLFYIDHIGMETPDAAGNKTFLQISSETYTKGDSPIIPLDPRNPDNIQSSPYALEHEKSPTASYKYKPENGQPRLLSFTESTNPLNLPRKILKNRNSADAIRNIIEADMWQNQNFPLNSTSPVSLACIPEESSRLSESNTHNMTNRRHTTFAVNQTFDKIKTHQDTSCKKTWNKCSVKVEPDLWKIPESYVRTEVPRKNQFDKDITHNISSLSLTLGSHTDYLISNVYSMSSTIDPFLAQTYFYDEKAVDNFEKGFKKWLNCLLTPPAEFDTNTETKVDVGKVWMDTRNKEVPAAPTREQVSIKYNNSHRLDSLRKSAKALLTNPKMIEIFGKLGSQIDRKVISVRGDKNLHLDVGLQKIIMELLLCYNPLWLRIGLEALYGTIIPLSSNSDVYGLTTFIIQRMFKDPYLRTKHSHPTTPNMLMPAYTEYMKKFTLKKYFMLVYFLDQAKEKKLIPHDPCLFCRNAHYKESREMLIRFTREMIAGIGDITKHLRPLGYVVSHKQSFLDEFKFAVHNLASDLKDGVRLTKVMEIILVKPNLTRGLRTPPISRMQKIHNVELALNALKESDFKIVGNIDARDIVDGHREKTLSLLWQIIHVFRAPLFEKAAIRIQAWWKKKYLIVWAQRRVEERILRKKNNAAYVIQTRWRKVLYQRLVVKKMDELVAATLMIQKYWRMWMYSSIYKNYKTAAVILQRWYRSRKLIDKAKTVLKQLQLRRDSIIKIQLWYRRQLTIKKILEIKDLYMDYCWYTQKRLMAVSVIKTSLRSYIIRKKYINIVFTALQKERARLLMINIMATKIQNYFRKWQSQTRYLFIRNCVINIQRHSRGMLARKRVHKLKWAIAFVQTVYKGKLLMRTKMIEFQKMKKSAIVIQSYYRMYVVQNYYKKLKNAVSRVEQKYLAKRNMEVQRDQYIALKWNVIIIQSHMRRYLNQKKYRALLTSAIFIQRQYRANRMAKILRMQYLVKRRIVVCIQSYVRRNIARKNFQIIKKASTVIQTRYRALCAMRECRNYYQNLLKSTRFVQGKFRANIRMVIERQIYCKQRLACVFIQRIYRANAAMKNERSQYQLVRKACLIIQARFRANKCRDLYKNKYSELRESCIFVQRRFRANILTKQCVKEYSVLKNACILIQSLVRRNIAKRKFDTLKTASIVLQSRYRAKMESRKRRSEYLKLLGAVRYIQAKFKANKLMKYQCESFHKQRAACIYIQRLRRANVAMKEQRSLFETLKKACVCIQIRFRAKQLANRCKNRYKQLQNTCIFVQKKYRAKLVTRKCVKDYTTLRKACLVIQCRYRALMQMRKDRNKYRLLCRYTKCLQARYRALLTMRVTKKIYTEKRNACIVIQRNYRAYKRRILKIKEREYAECLLRKNACLKIQDWYRATQKMHVQRNSYFTIRRATIFLQTKYKATITMRKERNSYILFSKSVRVIQARFRAQKEMVKCRCEFTNMKQKAITIQRWYRAVKLGVTEKNCYISLRKSAIVLQRRYRANLMMSKARTVFVEQRIAAINIQQWYRSIKLMLVHRKQYKTLRQAIIKIQSTYRMHIAQKSYQKLRNATVFIQQWYKLHKEGARDRQKYLQTKMAVTKIQATVRAFLQRKLYLKIQKVRRLLAVISIQKNFRAFLARRKFCRIVKSTVVIQTRWRARRLARLHRSDYVTKKGSVITLQAAVRAFLARKHFQQIKEDLEQKQVERRRNNAALKIQSIWRGHQVRKRGEKWTDVVKLRRRWQQGALKSTQETLAERNEDALEVLCHFSDIASVIRAFISLELLTSVFPMIYEVDRRAKGVSTKLIMYMSVTNRSISSLETLRLGASILVNMARYKPTAMLIYDESEVSLILKLMMRWCDKDGHLFRVLCTYLWLFGKYPTISKELKTILRTGDNNKMLSRIRTAVMRKKRMDDNSCKNKQQHNNSLNTSMLGHAHWLNSSMAGRMQASSPCLMPLLEPDFGLMRDDRPRFFETEIQGIDAIFMKFSLPINS